MDRSEICFADIERVTAITCFEHFISANLEHLTFELPNQVRILGHQNGFSSYRCHGKASVIFRCVSCCPETGQIHSESGALPGTASGCDVSATLFNDAINRGEPET